MSALTSISVRHNMEVAHRLSLLPGKCENIHGHSMNVDLTIYGPIDSKGILGGLEFGAVKKCFRDYLDGTYDHKLLLNKEDPWAQSATTEAHPEDQTFTFLPGLVTFDGDPTTENLARWIGEWARERFFGDNVGHIDVVVHETAVNAATWST